MKSSNKPKINYKKKISIFVGILLLALIGSVSISFYRPSAQTKNQPQIDAFELRAGNDYGIVDVQRYINTLPKESDKMIIDRRLIDRKDASVRIFQLYKSVPMHYHGQSDTYLYILSGRAKFQIGNEVREVEKGTLLYWKKGIYHGTPEILEQPLIALAFDAPARNSADAVWLNPKESPDVFLNK